MKKILILLITTLSAGQRTHADIEYVYDSKNRLSHINLPNDERLSYTYTQDNCLETLTYPSGSIITYSYNDQGLKTEASLETQDLTYTVYYEYDHDHTLSYAYDSLGNEKAYLPDDALDLPHNEQMYLVVAAYPRNLLKQDIGHAWLEYLFSDGTLRSIGHYKSVPSIEGYSSPYDHLLDKPNICRKTFPISPALGQASYNEALDYSNEPYDLTTHNCACMVAIGLHAAEIEHPDFETIFADLDPHLIYKWIVGDPFPRHLLPYPQTTQQEMLDLWVHESEHVTAIPYFYDAT